MNITLGKIGSADENISAIIQQFKDTHPVETWKTFGLFDDELLETINVHWLKFLPPHNINHYILAVLYAVIMIAGWCGNAFVIFMFVRCPSLRTPANTLVMNLAISDLLMMSKMPIFVFNSILLGPALGKIGCNIYGFVGGLSGTVSICTLAAISLDRYYVIKFPLHMRFTSLRAKIFVAIAWCYGAVFSAIPLFNLKFGCYVPEGYLTSCSFDYLSSDMEIKIFILVFFIAAWVVPFFLIAVCYINIIKTVLETQNVTKAGTESSRHMKIEDKRRQEVKLAITILFIISLWFAAWTPYSVVALLGIANRADLISPLASMIPALFCKSASCIDPFIYAINNPKFRTEVRKLFSRAVGEEFRTTRMWSTRGYSKTTHSTRQKAVPIHACQPSDEVEEEMVSIGEIVVLEPSTLKQQEAVATQTTMELSNCKPVWWYNPNFSNSATSFRSIARKLSLQQRSKNSCEYCEETQETTQ